MRELTLLVLPFELLDEVVDGPLVEVFATQVRVTSRSFDLEDTLLNCEERQSAC